MRILMKHVTTCQGAGRWAECSPQNVFYISEILKAFSHAKIIHVVRDGRDVAVSLANKGWIENKWGEENGKLFTAGIYWCWVIKRGIRAETLYPQSVFRVSYEDLVLNEQVVLEQLGVFIHHKFDLAQIRRRKIGSVGKPNSSFVYELSNSSFSPIGIWKRQLKPDEAKLLQGIIATELKKVNYSSKSSPRITFLDRLRKIKILANFELRLRTKKALGRVVGCRLDLDFLNTDPSELGNPTFRPKEYLKEIQKIIQNRD